MLKKCNNCGFQQNEFLNINGRNYCKSCNSEINVSGNLITAQKEKTAHELKLALGNLHFMLEALEKFTERAYGDNYPIKSQLYRRKIEDDNYPLENSREQFLTQLLIMKGVCKGEPEFFRNEIKKEFNKWFSATGIDTNNCPDEIKHFLFEINEVLEDRGEKIVREKEARIKNIKFDPKGVIGLFGALQEPMNKAREEGKNYEGKKWNELGNENRFNVSDEQGEKGREVFQQIHQEIASKKDNFSFYSPQQHSNSEIIQDVKNNPQSWRIDEIITGYDGYLGKPKEEVKLIHRSAKMDYDVMGNLKIGSEPIYQWGNFSEREKTEINRALNIFQTSTNQPIRWELINSIKQHANEFRTERLVVSDDGLNYNEETWIIHNSAQMKSDKNGCLVFDPDKMVKVKDLTQAEKEAIGYKSEQASQTNSSSTPKNDDKGIGKGGIIAIISIISVLAIAGIVVAKKRLTKKV